MKSVKPGTDTSAVELSNVSPHGIWIFIGGRELFLDFKFFPWFADASIHKLARIELPSPDHLYWPDLDVDLTLESIEPPELYPLVSQPKMSVAAEPTRKSKYRS
jgi:hypothetical protein